MLSPGTITIQKIDRLQAAGGGREAGSRGKRFHRGKH